MECSFCHSTNLVKVSLAYEQGLSELQSRSRLGGLSLATSGLGFWSGEARTTGTVQTRLSARLSPPTKMSYWKTTLWWLLGLLALWFVGIALMPENAHKAKEFGQTSAWVADAYAAALVFLRYFIWRYNHRVFPVQHKRWDRSFMCRRCGKIIRVNGDASAGDE